MDCTYVHTYLMYTLYRRCVDSMVRVISLFTLATTSIKQGRLSFLLGVPDRSDGTICSLTGRLPCAWDWKFALHADWP